MTTQKQLDNLLKGNPETQFKAGQKQSEIARQGGIALGEANKKRKSMKELSNIMLDCLVNNKKKDVIKDIFPDLQDNELTNSALLLAKQIEKAMHGDTKAFEVIRDTSGNKPIDKVENLNRNIDLNENDDKIFQEYEEKKKKEWERENKK